MQSKPRSVRLAGTIAVVLLLCVTSFSFFLTTRPSTRAHAATTGSGFVQHSGSGLRLNGAPFRFAGANIYWLGSTGVESGVSYDQQVTNILQIVSSDPPNGMSETVVRATGMGTDIGCGDNTCIEPTLNNIPQNSAAFQRMDYTIWQAGQDNIRLDIPFVDYWNYGSGGIDTWLAWHGYPIVAGSDGYNGRAVDGSADYGPFWTDSNIIRDFESYIGAFLNHVNSITGVAYKNDPTIMSWELGNELDSAPASWDATIANYIKSVDPNHLVSFDSRFGLQNNNSLGISSIDLEQGHYYPMNNSEVASDAQTANNNGQAYYVGEYGWDSGTPADLSSFLSTIETTNQGYLISGDTYWSLFPKDVQHNDGFTLHFPGDNATMDQEINILTTHAQVMRSGDVLTGGGNPTPTPTSGGGSSAPIGQTIWLKASNGYYVSAWLNDPNNPLEARNATTVQAWEEYTVVNAGNGLIALQAVANGEYVSAWTSDTNTPLEARSTHIQAWEEFTWISQGSGSVALLASANNLYVSAWQSDTNTPLEARSTWIQGWETFQWGRV